MKSCILFLLFCAVAKGYGRESHSNGCCREITIESKNRRLQGIYIHGRGTRPYYVKTTEDRAIWYNSRRKAWCIGFLNRFKRPLPYGCIAYMEHTSKCPIGQSNSIETRDEGNTYMKGECTDPIKCNQMADVAFLLDASGSNNLYFGAGKRFLKEIARALNLGKSGLRAGVITFSDNAKVNIKLKDHRDIRSFNQHVDRIRFMNGETHIDQALRKAHTEFFTTKNGARKNAPKVVILFTDGWSTVDPAPAVAELRRSEIPIFTIGVGKVAVNHAKELQKISGSADNTFIFKSTQALEDPSFIRKFQVKTCEAAHKKCNQVADIAFVLDSSGSIEEDYQNEKNFLKEIAGGFGLSKDRLRAGVITFGTNAVLSIKLNAHHDIGSFNKAVDMIPFMNGESRVDLSLRKAQTEFFTNENGGRNNAPKVVILITDGVCGGDPASIAAQLRRSGISTIVVGIGSGVNSKELEKISGSLENTFLAKSFHELQKPLFVRMLQKKSCENVKNVVSDIVEVEDEIPLEEEFN